MPTGSIAARKVREKGEVPRIDRSRAGRVQRLREQELPDPAQVALAKRQATVRATYERSIAELSASPSMVNQMVAKSVGRFVAAMPVPEPNSVRASRDRNDGRGMGRTDAAEATAERDRPAAAMARLSAATARSKATLAAARERELERERMDRSGTDDPSRTSPERSDRQPAAQPSDRIAEILRQVQERDHAHRDRQREQEQERSRDRGRSR